MNGKQSMPGKWSPDPFRRPWSWILGEKADKVWTESSPFRNLLFTDRSQDLWRLVDCLYFSWIYRKLTDMIFSSDPILGQLFVILCNHDAMLVFKFRINKINMPEEITWWLSISLGHLHNHEVSVCWNIIPRDNFEYREQNCIWQHCGSVGSDDKVQ